MGGLGEPGVAWGLRRVAALLRPPIGDDRPRSSARQRRSAPTLGGDIPRVDDEEEVPPSHRAVDSKGFGFGYRLKLSGRVEKCSSLVTQMASALAIADSSAPPSVQE